MKYILNDFQISPGRYRLYSSLQHIASYYGYPLAEHDLFFICNGMNFEYKDFGPPQEILPSRKFCCDTIDKVAAHLSSVFDMNVTVRTNITDQDNLKNVCQAISEGNPVIIFVDPRALDYLARELGANIINDMYTILLLGIDLQNQTACIGDTFVVNNQGNVISHQGEINLNSLQRTTKGYMWFDFKHQKSISSSTLIKNVIDSLELFLKGGQRLNSYYGSHAFVKCINDLSYILEAQDNFFETYCLEIAYLLKEYFMQVIDYLLSFLELGSDSWTERIGAKDIFKDLESLRAAWNSFYYKIIKCGYAKNRGKISALIALGHEVIERQATIFMRIIEILKD